MTNIDLRSRLVAIVCTLLVSTACLVGAVGPATGSGVIGGQATTLTQRAVA